MHSADRHAPKKPSRVRGLDEFGNGLLSCIPPNTPNYSEINADRRGRGLQQHWNLRVQPDVNSGPGNGKDGVVFGQAGFDGTRGLPAVRPDYMPELFRTWRAGNNRSRVEGSVIEYPHGIPRSLHLQV